MIREISHAPKPRTPAAKRLFYTLLLLIFATIAVAAVSPLYKGLIGLGTVALMIGAIVVFNVYLAGEFTYSVFFDSTGTANFIVEKRVGKKITTMTRLELADIKSVKTETPAEQHRHKTPYDTKKYRYLPTLGKTDRVRLTVANRYEKAEILLECDGDFASLLDEYAREARRLRAEDEERF